MSINDKLEALMNKKDIIDDPYEFSIQVQNLNDEIQESAEISLQDKMLLVDKFNSYYSDTNYKKMHVFSELLEWENSFGVKTDIDISKIKVSIVLPIYNKVNTGLAKGLQSCLSQTHKNLEIICVNDCSTDDSLKVIEHFAKIDTRIVSLDLKENKKCSGARIAGWEIVTGDYITNIDPDDWIDERYVEEALEAIVKLNTDIVNIFYPTIDRVLERTYYGSIGDIPFLPPHWYTGVFPHNVCGKMYKTNIVKKSLDKLKSVNGINTAEDLLLNVFLLSEAKSISILNIDSKYHYENNVEGIMSGQTFQKKMADISYASYILREHFSSFHIDRNIYKHFIAHLNVYRDDTSLHEKMKQFSTLDKSFIPLVLAFLYQDLLNEKSDYVIIDNMFKKYKLNKIKTLIDKISYSNSVIADLIKVFYKITKYCYKLILR